MDSESMLQDPTGVDYWVWMPYGDINKVDGGTSTAHDGRLTRRTRQVETT